MFGVALTADSLIQSWEPSQKPHFLSKSSALTATMPALKAECVIESLAGAAKGDTGPAAIIVRKIAEALRFAEMLLKRKLLTPIIANCDYPIHVFQDVLLLIFRQGMNHVIEVFENHFISDHVQ